MPYSSQGLYKLAEVHCRVVRQTRGDVSRSSQCKQREQKRTGTVVRYIYELKYTIPEDASLLPDHIVKLVGVNLPALVRFVGAEECPKRCEFFVLHLLIDDRMCKL